MLVVAYWFVTSMYGCGDGNDTAARVLAAEATYNEYTNSENDGTQFSREQIAASTQELADAYLAYAASNPDAEDTPERLYKAAELFQINLLDITQAMDLYDRIIADYPNHNRAANSLFSKGYVYHNTMHDLDQARATFTQFIAEYPEHDLVPHAQFELDNLGLSAKEALERIQRQQESLEEESTPNDPG